MSTDYAKHHVFGISRPTGYSRKLVGKNSRPLDLVTSYVINRFAINWLVCFLLYVDDACFGGTGKYYDKVIKTTLASFECG